MNYYAQYAKVTTQPGKRDELVQALQHLTESSELLKPAAGCIYYLIGTTDEPDVVWVSELWTSKEAKDAVAANAASAQAMRDTFMPFIASMGEPIITTVVGGAGI